MLTNNAVTKSSPRRYKESGACASMELPVAFMTYLDKIFIVAPNRIQIVVNDFLAQVILFNRVKLPGSIDWNWFEHVDR